VEFVKKFPKTFNTDYWPKLMQGALDKAGLTFADVLTTTTSRSSTCALSR
jgi:hypothetical protein